MFAALRRLPDPWRVFHSVAWTGMRDGRPSDGEADFVLLHPEHGLVVVEVKGGGVRLEAGKWFSYGREGKKKIKNPYRQATDSKHSLVSYLKGSKADFPYLPAGHAVTFPDLTGKPEFGPDAPPSITITRSDLTDSHGRSAVS